MIEKQQIKILKDIKRNTTIQSQVSGEEDVLSPLTKKQKQVMEERLARPSVMQINLAEVHANLKNRYRFMEGEERGVDMIYKDTY